MTRLSTPMMRQIESIPALYESINAAFEERARLLLSHEEILSLKRITLTGCGDSYCAAEIGRSFFEQLTDLDCYCKSSIDVARIIDKKQLLSKNGKTMLIGVSVSGAVTRVAEALARVKNIGAISVGLTGNPASLVGQNADNVLNAAIPPFELLRVYAHIAQAYLANALFHV